MSSATVATVDSFAPRLSRRQNRERWFVLICLLMLLAAVSVLGVLLARVWWESRGWLSVDFLKNFPSVLYPEKAGCKSALYGSLWVITLTGLFSVPTGIAAAIYLHEYAPHNRITSFIHLNIANLAGVPSIVYGILGLALFIRWMHLGRSVLAGGLTLALLVLPVIIIASREALLAVPDSIRLAAFSLGATRWQMVRSHVLPAAIPGILTGVILAISRAVGETAPLIMIGGLTYVTFVPDGPLDDFTALPLQIYNWCDAPQKEFHHLAAAGIVVLLGVLFFLNALAVILRGWQQRRRLW